MNKQYHRQYLKYKGLVEKTVVITGASSGAGRAIALAFARHKAKIVLAARNSEALDEVEAECREMGALALAIPTDVTDAGQVKALADKAAEFGGSIDIWINNAGVLAAGAFEKTPIEVHTQVIRTNLVGYMNGAHAVLPYFKYQNQGVLINNISVGGFFPVPYAAGYSASKFGLRGFSEALKGELSSFPHIHVCDFYPAFLDSPGVQHAANYTGRALRPAPPVYDPQMLARAIVHVSLNPKSRVTVGSVAHLLKATQALFPALSRNTTAKVMETYFKKAEKSPEDSGNLFLPAPYGTSIHGGWNSQADADIRKKVLKRDLVIGGVVAGLAIAAKLIFQKQQKPGVA